LYAFPKPGDADKSILIMNVHPSDVVDPPGPTTAEPFSPEALYEIRIDTDGDAVADITFRVRFSSSGDGSQTATVRRVEGAQAAATGDRGQIIVEAAPVSTGRNARMTEAGGYSFFAGWRSDPFFFDTRGALNNMQFTGDDFFADKDVCSIVLEVPNSVLGRKRVGLWARTLRDAGGVWIQADRGALPLQVAFLVGEERDAYLAGEPAEDSRFLPVFAHSFEHAGGYTPEEARRLAGTLLPDMLSYDPTRPARFPGNGRTLTDNVGDVFLTVLTNGRVPGEKIAAHSDLLVEFPYLGRRTPPSSCPHEPPEISRMKIHILAATLVAAVMAGINPAHAGTPAGAPGTRTDAAPRQEIRLERLTAEYWRVTLDNPPFNIFGPETIPQLNTVITQIETDPKVKVVVFQSAVPGFFLTHYDFVPPLSATTDMLPGATGLAALPDMLVRLSRAPVVSIVSIRGRASGVGSELSLASDMRFASREKAVLSQWEIGAGLVPVAAQWPACHA